ncbi:MAG: glycosyltransferase [Bacteroidia bacterium]|nr:glycosyltransferase [Bacteroidia bacterium]
MPDWLSIGAELPIASFLSYLFSGLVALYWLGLGISWHFYQKKSLPPVEVLPPVSLLIAAHDAASHLKRLFERLRQIDYPSPWEVIVAADRCTDDTELILKEAAAYLPLRWLSIPEVPRTWKPKKYALWQATCLASYEWCVLIDADVDTSTFWLERLMRSSSGKEAVLAPAWLIPQSALGSRLSAYEAALVQVEALGRAAMGYPYMATGRGWAIRKSWLRAGLYRWRKEISGDDDLTFQMLPSAYVGIATEPTYSQAPASFQTALLRKWRHLQTARAYPFLLRVSLALPPLLQLLSVLGPIWSPEALPALFLPPVAKAIALAFMRAPRATITLWLDPVLLLLQVFYPVGAWVRKNTWALFFALSAYLCYALHAI